MEWPLSAFLPDTEVYCTPPPPPMVEEGQRLMGLDEDDGMGRSKRGQGAGMCTCECVSQAFGSACAGVEKCAISVS